VTAPKLLKGVIMENCLFSVESIGSILTECYKNRDGLETGGILIGNKDHNRIITDILPSTTFAERESHTYFQSEKDVEILNVKLKRYQTNGKRFLGYFHWHPSGMKYLSSGDIDTCLEILTSPNYAINNYLLMCIITEVNGRNGLPVFAYAVSLNHEEAVEVEELAIKIMPKKCIEEFTACL
jgi:proteasome lid subunit RPN8/RPN11